VPSADPGTRATLAASGIEILDEHETLELYQGAEFPLHAGHLSYHRVVTIRTPRRNVATLDLHGVASFPPGTQLPLPKPGPPYPSNYHHSQPGDASQLDIPASTGYWWLVSVEYADPLLRKWLPSTYHPAGGNVHLRGSGSVADTASGAPLFAKLGLTPWAQCKSLADFVDRSEDAAREEARRNEEQAEELDVEPPAPPGPEQAEETVRDEPPPKSGLAEKIFRFLARLLRGIASLWNALPWYVRGVLKWAAGIALTVGAVFLVSYLIVGALAEIGVVVAVATVAKVIGALLASYVFVNSVVGLVKEGANPFAIPGIAILETIGVRGMVESFTDRSMVSGTQYHRSKEERLEAFLNGGTQFLATALGARGLLRRGAPATIDTAPPEGRPPPEDHPGMDQWTEGHDPAPQVITRLRQARCTIGEQGVAFSGYPQSEGWGFIEGPSGGGGHAWNAPGFDGVAFRVAGPFEVEVIDNKAFASEGNVSSSSALTRNLQTNLGDLAAQIADPVYNDVPRIADLRSAISRAQAAVQNGSPLPPEVRLVVTNFGGRSGGITATLQALGITFRDVNR
jgi:hypothetical protein